MIRDRLVEKILIFVEGNEASILAAKYAICLAKQMNGELHAVYVVDTKVLDDLLKARIFVKMEEMDYERDLEEDGRRYLRYVEDLASALGISAKTHLGKGEVHNEVVKKAKEIGTDLIVMGELGEVKSRRDVFYDESERIFRESESPVLVVKNKEWIEDYYDRMA
ncbi:MAG: universal stress protein [Candidatus Theseobacter exili]|nr:universal stress protein [Candidatus Theseobacter exili]